MAARVFGRMLTELDRVCVWVPAWSGRRRSGDVPTAVFQTNCHVKDTDAVPRAACEKQRGGAKSSV